MIKLGANWKTNVAGILSTVLSVPIFTQALSDWGQHKSVNWPLVLVGIVTAVNAGGFFSAKDSNVTGGTKLNDPTVQLPPPAAPAPPMAGPVVVEAAAVPVAPPVPPTGS